MYDKNKAQLHDLQERYLMYLSERKELEKDKDYKGIRYLESEIAGFYSALRILGFQIDGETKVIYKV